MKRNVALIGVYIILAFSTAIGTHAGFRHQCGVSAPFGFIILTAAVWPIAVTWAAMKGAAPLYICDDPAP